LNDDHMHVVDESTISVTITTTTTMTTTSPPSLTTAPNINVVGGSDKLPAAINNVDQPSDVIANNIEMLPPPPPPVLAAPAVAEEGVVAAWPAPPPKDALPA